MSFGKNTGNYCDTSNLISKQTLGALYNNNYNYYYCFISAENP